MHNYQYENVIKIHLARVVFEYHIVLQNIARQLFDSSYFLLKENSQNTTITIFGNVMYSIANQAVALIYKHYALSTLPNLGNVFPGKIIASVSLLVSNLHTQKLCFQSQ